MFAIGQASAQSGVNIETIRYYEREGIVTKPNRSTGGRREYTADEIARLRFVKLCRDLGFSVPMVQAMLSLASKEDRPCCEAKYMARDQLPAVAGKIEQLTRLQEALQKLASCCDGESTAGEMAEQMMQKAYLDIGEL